MNVQTTAPAPYQLRRIAAHEWLEMGLPIATGLLGTFLAVYGLSSHADRERLRNIQFGVAVFGIASAFIGSVVAVQKVSERLAQDSRGLHAEGEAELS